MTTQPLPPHSHDLALLLARSLISQQTMAGGLVVGWLPQGFDFDAVDAALVLHGIEGLGDAATRKIEYYPSHAEVYPDLNSFLSKPIHLTMVPAKFTILDLNYTHGVTTSVPLAIAQYFSVVRLCTLLTKSADHTASGGSSLYFIKGHDAKVEVKIEYTSAALVELKALDAFATDFVDSTHHQEQKRTIVRSALLEIFKGSQSITVAELLPRFDSLMECIRNSYAMYVAEFSFEKVRAEVEKDNLDSTLKLNKTLSDIQNQLLAVPVALMLVGGQMLPAQFFTVKNLVIWVGSLVFAWIMSLLIVNQRNAIDAIGEEIRLRKDKIGAQPLEVATPFKKGFYELEKRSLQQRQTLKYLGFGMGGAVVFSTSLLIWSAYPSLRDTAAAIFGI